MKVLKFKKRIEIDKAIGNFHIETFHYGSLKTISLKIGQSYIVGMNVIVKIVC